MITKNKGKKVEQLVQVLLSPLSKKMVRIYTSNDTKARMIWAQDKLKFLQIWAGKSPKTFLLLFVLMTVTAFWEFFNPIYVHTKMFLSRYWNLQFTILKYTDNEVVDLEKIPWPMARFYTLKAIKFF